MNSVNLIGNIGNPPEMRQTQSGKAVCTFSLAVRGYNDTTDWIPITAWNKTAELTCQHCGRGSKIGVTGRLSAREYTDKNGNKRTAMEVVADSIDFTESKKSRETAPPTTEFAELDDSEDSDSLPF